MKKIILLLVCAMQELLSVSDLNLCEIACTWFQSISNVSRNEVSENQCEWNATKKETTSNKEITDALIIEII